MSLAAPLSFPFYSGTGVSTQVPGKFPVALDGVGYFIDTEVGVKMQTVPFLRNQADTGNLPGLSSINPEDLWRRDQETWHHGSGQKSFDREESDPARFRASKGVDCWTKWQFTLLPDTAQKRASVNTNLRMVPAGTRLYVTDGATLDASLRYTTDLATFTAVTGTPAVAPSSVVSNGFKVFAAYGASGVYVTNTGIGTAAQMVSTAVAADCVLGYVKGRLMVGTGRVLYNVTDLVGPAALPAALLTHPNTDFKWVGFANGQTVLYAAGYSGDKSEIYKTGILADGTALAAPVVAGELPDGEIVRSIYGYATFIVIGTDKGVRFAAADESGYLQIGGLIETSSPVHCFEGQDRFVWFGWTNYDTTSTGLGRLDPSVFTAPLVPAYASDLMATAQGTVQSVVTFAGQRVFTVSGGGFYAETTNKVVEGYLDTGQIGYGIPDEKIAVFIDVQHQELAGTHAVSLSPDEGEFVDLGTHSGGEEAAFEARQTRSERFELRHTLTRDSGDITTGPSITRWTARVYPSVKRSRQYLVPILLADRIVPSEGPQIENYMDPDAALEALFALAESPQLVTFQYGKRAATVFVKDVGWEPTHRVLDGQAWAGTATAKLITVRK